MINEELKLGKTERVHISINPITKLMNVSQLSSVSTYKKPKGIWYGMGDNWVNFAKYEMPDDYFKKRKFAYKLYINFDKICIIKSIPDAFEFADKYYMVVNNSLLENGIRWDLVAQDYDGIEIPNYEDEGYYNLSDNYGDKFNFLYTWGVRSGCIWNPRSIIKIKPL